MSITANFTVLNWLNYELNLNPNICNIQNEFQNGYRFGEILLQLKLITNKDFSLFKDSSKKEDIKDNFKLLKNYLHTILNLEIRLEEFDEIINYDKYKSTIVIYKIKNAFYKKKIYFNSIQTSITPLTQDEIDEKIRIIMDKTFENESEEKNNNDKNIRINTGKLKKDNSCKMILSSNINKDFNILNKKQTINNNPISLLKNKKQIRFQNYHSKQILLPIIQNKNIRYESAKKFEKKEKFKILNKSQSQSNLRNNSSLSFEVNPNNEIPIDKKKLTNNLMQYGLSYENIKNNDSIKNLFEKNKSQNNIIKSIKQKIIIKKINDLIYDVPEINFIKKDKKFLDYITNILNNKKNAYSFLENNFILYNRIDNSKYQTSSKRKEYAKKRENELNSEKAEKRSIFFNKLLFSYKQKQILNHKNFLRKNSSAKNILYKEEEKFDKYKYYQDINKLKFEDFNNYCKNRYHIFKNHYIEMNNIILLIIDIAMETYLYQEEKKTDSLDLSLYLKLIKLFLKNKKLRRPRIDDEYDKIKEVNKLEENIDIDKITLSDEEKYLLKDYLYYIGFWNKDKIIDNEFIGKKLDYKLILTDKIKNLSKYEEYEPTKTENEDLTLPKENINDYNYGDLILDIIENRYSNKLDVNNNIEKNISKWEYIPYKISLIGYPFSGKKSISEKIVNKYINLKIYSIQKILREYINQYKKITEPIENRPKFKSMKPNQIEQLKEEKQKQLDEFSPILKIIKPYLDIIENNKEDKNENDICIPQDEVLLNLLIYTIEKDFPKKNMKEIEEEINENKKKINNILNKIEKIKKNINEKKEKEKEKNKNTKNKNNQKDKDEMAILNLENEIQNIKYESIKGFILVDFPTNFNQCYLLENYLTGYIDELEKPKTLKNKMIQKVNNIIDINYKPNENKMIKKGGIDFIINIKLNEEEVNNRFDNIKYDPIEDKIYSKNEYEQINNKKVLERITNEIPYYNKSLFNYYKQEYENNIPQINVFYNKFGFISNENVNNIGTSLFTNENEHLNKTIKVYQSITPDRLNSDINSTLPENNIHKNENIKKKRISKKMSIKTKKIKENNNIIKNQNKSNIENKKKTENISDNLTPQEKSEMITNNIIEFIIQKIQILYEEYNKTEKQIIKESNKDNEEPSGTRNEIRKTKTKKQTSLLIERDRILLNVKIKSENIIKEIISLDLYYNDNLKIFIYLLNKQRFDIYNRLNLIQKKFRDFLNRETPKKKFIHTYVSKYNKFFNSNPDLFLNDNVKNEFLSDIEDINISLWTILNNKKNESIYELEDIKNCGFVEIELCKFFNHIKELFLVETHKFLNMINIILDFYIKNFLDERISLLKKNIANNTNNNLNEISRLRNKINEYFGNKKIKEDYIFNNLISISETFEKEKQKLDNNDIDNNDTEDIKTDRTKYNIFSDNILTILLKNINTLFTNSIRLLLNQNEKILPFTQILTEINNVNKKPKVKNKKSQVLINETLSSSSSNVNYLSQKDNIIISEENIKKIIKNEKIKYKYRICFIKSFSTKFILIISQLSQNIFHNADEWIIKSINLENDAQNEVINLLKNKLEDKKIIDEENEINSIEMDCFEKIIEEDDKSNKSIEIKMRPIDNSSVINSNRVYNKINIDFLIKDNFFDIKFEQNEKKETIDKKEEKNENIIDNINDDIKQYKVFIPKNNSNCISSNELSERSQMTNEEEKIKEEEYYYDINKFNEIYKTIKKFEIQNNIVSYDVFFEAFIKKYIISNHKQLNNNKKSSYIEIIFENNSEASNKEENNSIILDDFPIILKKMNYKQIKRLISFYQIHIDKNDDKDNEYDDYVKIDEIFTILSLIGCDILTKEKEEEIMKYFKDKLKYEKYIDKNEFMKYKFWFEKFFEYQNQYNIELKEDEINEKINIKDFLYELWKDETGNYINIKRLIDILKINNYITDLTEYTNKKYYDIIFYDN